MEDRKVALITGITGQDAWHLSKLLNQKNYVVYGLIRGQNNPKREELNKSLPYVKLIEADLTDYSSLLRALKISDPDEVYNLGAISHVGYSFKNPILTAEVTGMGVLYLLEAIRAYDKKNKIRFYQAATSEMFGGVDNMPAKGYNEDSPFHPRSPYGTAKLFAYWTTRNYRESYGMYAVSGILFNHEGERRGLEFVTRKITDAVARIKLGKQDCIELGDLSTKRDWGYAGDFVDGMWRMLQQKEPKDYVLATGETHSIEEFLEEAFRYVGITDWKPYVKQSTEFMRPAEVNVLLGDSSRAESELGWKRNVDFKGLVKLMVDNDLAINS